MGQPLIKGKLYEGKKDFSFNPMSWFDLNWSFGGTTLPLDSVNEIKFGSKFPPVYIYGKGPDPVAVANTNNEPYAEITIATRELIAIYEEAFAGLSPAQKNGRNILPFNLIITVDNYDGKFTQFTLIGCRHSNFDMSLKQNDPNAYTTMDLKPMRWEYEIIG